MAIRWTEEQLQAHIERRRGRSIPGDRKAAAQKATRYRFASKLEAEYAAYLDALKAAGQITDWDYEAVKLRLGQGAYYTPDFLVIRDRTVELRETKGHWREAARVRIKAAAERYPWFRFIAVQRKRGQWIEEAF